MPYTKENTNQISPTGEQGTLRIFLIGFMGCGKTHLGRELSERLQLPFFDLDEKLVEKEEKPINEIFEQEGEEYFRLLEKDVLYLLTESHDSFVMACGGGTPCFYNNIDYMKSKGVTVWINCSIECLYKRLESNKSSRPLVKDLSNDQLRSYIIKKFADRKIFYQQAALILSEDESDVDSLLKNLFN